MSIQDDLRRLTTGGPDVTHIAAEDLFTRAADRLDVLEAAVAQIAMLKRKLFEDPFAWQERTRKIAITARNPEAKS